MLNTKPQENIKPRHKTRTYIDQTTKCNLIKTVIDDHLTIYQAALQYKMKYSTAKHILRNFNQEARETFQHQRKKRTKLISKYATIVIDQCSGDIRLQINEQNFEVLPDLASIMDKCHKKILQFQSQQLYNIISTEKLKNIFEKNLCRNQKYQQTQLESYEDKIRFLTDELMKQHRIMSEKK